MCSYKNNLVLMFSSTIDDNSIEQFLVSFLTKKGIEVTVSSNETPAHVKSRKLSAEKKAKAKEEKRENKALSKENKRSAKAERREGKARLKSEKREEKLARKQRKYAVKSEKKALRMENKLKKKERKAKRVASEVQE